MKKKIVISIMVAILAIIIGFIIVLSVGFERHVHFWVLNSLEKTAKISFKHTTIDEKEELKEITNEEDISNIIKIIKNSKKKVSFNQSGLCNGPAYELYLYDKNDNLIDVINLFLGNGYESFYPNKDKPLGCGGKFVNKDKELSILDIILKEYN